MELGDIIAEGGIGAISDEQLQDVVNAVSIALWADGQPTDVEVRSLIQQLEATPWLAEKSAEEVTALFGRARQLVGDLLKAGDPERIMRTLQDVGWRLASDPMREVVFRIAVNLMLADRQVSEGEIGTTGAIAAAFGISQERGRAIVQELARVAGVA